MNKRIKIGIILLLIAAILLLVYCLIHNKKGIPYTLNSSVAQKDYLISKEQVENYILYTITDIASKKEHTIREEIVSEDLSNYHLEVKETSCGTYFVSFLSKENFHVYDANFQIVTDLNRDCFKE